MGPWKIMDKELIANMKVRQKKPMRAHQNPWGRSRSPVSPHTGVKMDGSGRERGGGALTMSHLKQTKTTTTSTSRKYEQH